MKAHRILFVGPAGAGTRAAIAGVSETPVRPTAGKPGEPGGMDLGLLTLDGGAAVHLLGAPGQGGFDIAWSALARDALGLVILVDNTRPDPLSDLGLYLEGFWDEFAGLPCVIGVGRTEECSAPSLDEYAAHLAQHGLVLPVVKADAGQREDVLLLLDLLLVQLEAMERQGGVEART